MMAAEKVGFFGGKNFLEREKKAATTMTLKFKKRGYLEERAKNIFEQCSPKPNRPTFGVHKNQPIEKKSKNNLASTQSSVSSSKRDHDAFLMSAAGSDKQSFSTVLKGHFGVYYQRGESAGRRGGHFPALDLRLRSACEVSCHLNKKEEQLLPLNPFFKEQSEVALQSRYLRTEDPGSHVHVVKRVSQLFK